MSASVAISCDAAGCPRVLLVPKIGRQMNATDAREGAKGDGWTTHRGRDWCPTHSERGAKAWKALELEVPQ